jgi:ABC-type branched-subunit amino acid transport system ATPase component
MTESALTVLNVTKTFGGLAAISDVSLEVPHGSLTALIGPNGAGKTTLFNLITNLLPSESGEILFYGTALADLTSGEIAELGFVMRFV